MESNTYPLGYHPHSSRGCGSDMINTNLIVNRFDPIVARIHYLPSVDDTLEGKEWIPALVWSNLLTIKLVLIMSVPNPRLLGG
jgi:hypothetical protein